MELLVEHFPEPWYWHGVEAAEGNRGQQLVMRGGRLMLHAMQRSHDRYATSLETVLRRDEEHLEADRHGQIGLNS